jgi:hypothetical protein
MNEEALSDVPIEQICDRMQVPAFIRAEFVNMVEREYRFVIETGPILNEGAPPDTIPQVRAFCCTLIMWAWTWKERLRKQYLGDPHRLSQGDAFAQLSETLIYHRGIGAEELAEALANPALFAALTGSDDQWLQAVATGQFHTIPQETRHMITGEDRNLVASFGRRYGLKIPNSICWEQEHEGRLCRFIYFPQSMHEEDWRKALDVLDLAEDVKLRLRAFVVALEPAFREHPDLTTAQAVRLLTETE